MHLKDDLFAVNGDIATRFDNSFPFIILQTTKLNTSLPVKLKLFQSCSKQLKFTDSYLVVQVICVFGEGVLHRGGGGGRFSGHCPCPLFYAKRRRICNCDGERIGVSIQSKISAFRRKIHTVMEALGFQSHHTPPKCVALQHRSLPPPKPSAILTPSQTTPSFMSFFLLSFQCCWQRRRLERSL